jgi:protein tyrosine phosphatase (PTP) superfamily phosphohydrolase (DUF442 family)
VEALRRASVRLQCAVVLLGLWLSTGCGTMQTIAGSDSWRSPQPNAEQLRIAAAHGVKSVVCLRKGRAGRAWFEEEVAVCRELGLDLRVLNWSAMNSSHEQIDRLIEALDEMSPPYLFHCQAGVDRSGLAAAVFRVVVMGHSKKEAGAELSIWRGHVPVLGTRAMDRAWRRFRWPTPAVVASSDEPIVAGP